MERREKVEEARRETQRILSAQEAEVAARKVRPIGRQLAMRAAPRMRRCVGSRA